ncbi:MAG: tripartite tricarboxylate transporter TctB family protein [Ramlibacter sp.]|nr:tripartite tricarboxylate transporter TctB family protein [Gemmatimonadales bacterium]MBA3773196.1 tripartite tricarboxylate transporter TctB family protein [Ramlibacter sp.]
MTNTQKMQSAVGAGVLLIGLALAAGALSIPAAAGYGGVGPNFLPWVVAVSLIACGVLIVREALTGGFRAMDPPSGAERAYWPAFAWVSAALLANAALITTLGFILSCTLCYMLAVQGLRRAGGQAAGRPVGLAIDAATGAAIAAPVYWTFTKFLGINLPGLTQSGWL